MRNKLIMYGFDEEQTAQLLKGKELRVFYGVVKLNRKTRELVTRYHDRKRDGKIEQL